MRDDEVGRAVVVEIGAGTGNLTRKIAPRAKHLFAIERDRDLVPGLRKEFDVEGVTLLEADAKTVPLEDCFGEAALERVATKGAPRILAGNLPYQITGMLLERAVAHRALIDRAVFMVQREVADRIVAEPNSKTYGALSVFVQAAFTAKRLFLVAPGAFFPPPKVTSAVIELVSRNPPRAEEDDAFRAVVKRAFEQRRKQLRNAWSSFGKETLEALADAGLPLEARGETLSVEEFAKAASVLRARRTAERARQ